MRLEGGAGMPLRLIAAPADLRILDLAFPELLDHVRLDDWRIRTGATREEACAVWTGIAGSRHVPVAGEDAVTLAVSERAIEILKAAVFEIARDRSVGIGGLEARTGVSYSDWLRLYRQLESLVASLDLDSAPLQPVADAPRPEPDGDGAALERFRESGRCLTGVSASGTALDTGDARNIQIERSQFADLTCRGARLIDSTVSDSDISGAFSECAVIDCTVRDVAVSGRLSGVRFVGGSWSGVDLRSAQLIQCRFWEFGPGEGIDLPDGNDCFVVPVAAVERAFDPIRGRVGRDTLVALTDWLSLHEADYVSVAPAFWSTEMLTRGAHDDDEVEYAVMNRLFRVRVSSIASMR